MECQKTIDIVKASRQGHSKDNGGTEAAATSSEPKNLTQLPASLSFHHAATMAGFSPSAATLQIPDGSRERVLNAQRVPSPSASASGLAGMGLSSSSAALNNDLLTRNQRAIDLANNRSFAPYGNSGLPGTSTTLATNSSRRLNYAALNTAPGPIAVNSRYILLEQQAALERARLAVAQNNYSRGIAPAPAGMTNVYNMLPTSLRVATTLDNSSSSLATTGLNGVNQGNSPASLEEQLARMRNQGASPYASDVFASSSYSEERKRQSLEEELGLIRSNASKRQRYF